MKLYKQATIDNGTTQWFGVPCYDGTEILGEVRRSLFIAKGRRNTSLMFSDMFSDMVHINFKKK